MNPRWLLRMSQMARHPPAMWKVKLGLGVIAVCLLLFGMEYFGLWPEGLTTERMRGPAIISQ